MRSFTHLVMEYAKMKRFYSLFLTLGLLAGLLPSDVLSAGGTGLLNQWVLTHASQTRLIANRTGISDPADIVLGLHIKLDKGWKTYWRNPGDSGLPPQFNWSEADNIAHVEILWPKPRLFDTYGFFTWGYQNEVVFPIRITLKDPAKGLDAKLQAFYGICAEICVPVTQNFAINLPTGPSQSSSEASLIEYFQAQVPMPLTEISENSPILAMSAQGVADNSLIISIEARDNLVEPSLILEGQAGDFFTITDIHLSDSKKSVKFFVDASLINSEQALKGRLLTATILDTAFAVEGRAVVD